MGEQIETSESLQENKGRRNIFFSHETPSSSVIEQNHFLYKLSLTYLEAKTAQILPIKRVTTTT